MRRSAGAVTLTLAVLMTACQGGDGTEATPTERQLPETATAPAGTPTGLTEYDRNSFLLVKGRDRLRACVEVLDDSMRVEDAAEAIEEALLRATNAPRWPDDYDAPAVAVGCPLPPVALTERDKPFHERKVCRHQVSPYMVFVFVGEASQFEEPFPEWVVPGVRKAIQEDISVGTSACHYDVSEAWYLTPEELQDADLLQDYALSIFAIADVGIE